VEGASDDMRGRERLCRALMGRRWSNGKGAASWRAGGGDDRLVALAELPFCYPEPGAGVGSTEFRPTAVTMWGRERLDREAVRYEAGRDSTRALTGPRSTQGNGAASWRAGGVMIAWWPLRSCPFVILNLGQEWAQRSFALPP
jgi:hypothetical protein